MFSSLIIVVFIRIPNCWSIWRMSGVCWLVDFVLLLIIEGFGEVSVSLLGSWVPLRRTPSHKDRLVIKTTTTTATATAPPALQRPQDELDLPAIRVLVQHGGRRTMAAGEVVYGRFCRQCILSGMLDGRR